MKIPLRSRIHVTEEHDECLRYSRFALSRCWDTLRRGRLRHMVAARMEHPKVLNLSKMRTIATVLFGALAAVSCGGASANARPPATAASASDVDEVAAGLTEHHRHHHHGGVTLLIALSLDTLGISPEQRPAVEKIRRDLHARMEPARAAQQRLAAALAGA